MLNKFLRVGARVPTSLTPKLKVPATSGIPLNSNATILKALHSTALSPVQQTTAMSYQSPYRTPKPLDTIVLYNRSPYAMQTAEDELKKAWPDMHTLHVVKKGTQPAQGASMVLEVDDWGNVEHLKTKYNEFIAQHPALRAAMLGGKVGFYDIWAPLGENSTWARAVIAAGFQRIGASPDKMDQLDKINLKRLCVKLGIPTAYFNEISVPETQNIDQCFKLMAQDVVDLYHNNPQLQGNAVFLKHINGGGGRGSKKVASMDMTLENVEAVIRQIVKDTGGNPDGVYIEEALDFSGCQMMQLELECDGPTRIEEEARLVFFNLLYQKVLEIGFTSTAIQKFLSHGIFQACRDAAKVLIAHTGYDNRGTIEILMSFNHTTDECKYFISEVNMRRQVEAPAIETLVVDAEGRTRNTTAEQVMRSCGFPAPGAEDFRKAGPEIVGHIRLLSAKLSEKGMDLSKGVVIDGSFSPPDVDVKHVLGQLKLADDAQIGRALISAQNWEEFCSKLYDFSQTFQFYGPKTEVSNYLTLFAKLAKNPKFIAGKLGCDETFSVLSDRPAPKGKHQKIIEDLAYTVTPLIVHGYRPTHGIKGRSHPTSQQIADYKQLMAGLAAKTPSETPFSRLLTHQDYNRYIVEKKNHLEQHGGGTVSVMRDVIQALMDQEAALVQKSLTKIVEVHGARSGVIVGNEEGGAQYQAGEMRTFKWLAILIAGCPTNLSAHSLMRSIFMNGLKIKSIAKQTFVANTLQKVLKNHYGWQSNATMLPWEPNNFHAGNHSQGDITTGIMLDANIPVIPNFAWDPRNTPQDFKDWVVRQIVLFKEKGHPLHQIRIKNPGQGPKWNADVMVSMVATILRTCDEHGIERPIIHIHNHNFNNKAAEIAVEAIRRCQDLGYRWLIVDSVPDGFISHNSNQTIADSGVWTMSPEEKEHFDAYNDGVRTIAALLSRYNNQDITKEIQDPNSEWAGGTNSSDIADAIKLGIPVQDIPKALALAKALFGLGTPVTPYSEALKQAGFSIYVNKEIQPKTIEATRAYLKKGGKLALSDEILHWFSAWRTLLPRPKDTEQLLINHGFPLDSNHDVMILNEALDIQADRKWLQAQLPNTVVGDEELATYYMFDKIGLDALKHRDRSIPAAGPRNMSALADNPELVYGANIQVGDSFTLEGEVITIERLFSNPETGLTEVDYHLDGRTIRTSCENPAAMGAEKKAVRTLTDPNIESAAPMPSKLLQFFVKKGDKVAPGQKVAEIEAMKMTQIITAPASDKDWIVDEVLGRADEEVEKEQVLVTFKPC